ncbi:MAG TPA: serine hydrolase, partial [Salinimicrobium sp.]|nr:serine hydrolase [Salinimicrobium sp.]
EKEEFHAASTMKTPVMIEVFKQAEQGKFSLSDSVIVKNEFKSIVDGSTYSLDISRDSADKLYSHIGEKSSIEDLMIGMIIHSSNLATNNIVELIDAKKANQTMRELGAKDIMVLRGVEDIKAYEAGLSNTTTAYDLMLIYEKLAKGEVVSEEASQRMTEILLRQQHNDIIPALLPEEVKVAHKTGSITGVRHDSGMVILPDGRKYVLVLLSEDIKDSEAGIKVLAQVSRMVYDYMAGKEE